jgi:hypothetical protein
MKDSTKIEVKKISFLDKKIKADVKAILLSLGKISVSLFLGNNDKATLEAISILKEFKIESGVSDLAYSLFRTALINSSHNLIQENSNKLKSSIEEKEKLYDSPIYVDFLDSIPDILNQQYEIDITSIKQPRRLQLLKDYQTIFGKSLIILGINKVEAKHITNRFPTYFINNLNAELSSNWNTYSPLFQALETPLTSAAQKEQEWEHYYSYLQKVVEEPVFEETFSLKQVYIPLRAYYNEKVDPKIEFHQDQKEKILIDLSSELNNWIYTKEKKNTIKVISGGPGAGKSSFLKIWAAELSEQRSIRTLFIPLHLFNTKGSLKDSIEEYISNLSFFSHSNPYNELDVNNRLLIIFDGLDELSKQGGIGETIARNFVGEIERACGLINQQEIKLLILISGRELILQSLNTDFRQKKQVLNLLPYYIEESEYRYFEANDSLRLDQRDQWWQIYGRLTAQSFEDGIPEYLKTAKIGEITAQPLLNYLVTLSVKRAKIDFSLNTNLNEIYLDLIEGVHERAYEQKRQYKSIKGLSCEDFIRILEEIAISAWHGGDVRTTTVNRITKHIEAHNLGKKFSLFKEDAKSGITKLLTAFYFRQAGQEESGDKTFEFTHKSFGEFLTARRLVNWVTKTSIGLLQNEEDSDVGIDKRAALIKWTKLTGQTPVDKYLFNFILDEIKLQKIEDVHKWQKVLSHLFSYSLKKGIPFGEERKDIFEEQRIARNAEEALIVLINCCARVTKNISPINWENNSFPKFLSRMQPFRISPANTIAYDSLSYIEISKNTLHIFDLYNSNLSYSTISECDFNLSTLYFGFFIDTKFENCKFQDADLADADLTGADLTGADLTDADLTGADLTCADLTGADLTRVDLSKVNSLHRTKGIPNHLLTKLKQKYLNLFKPK